MSAGGPVEGGSASGWLTYPLARELISPALTIAVLGAFFWIAYGSLQDAISGLDRDNTTLGSRIDGLSSRMDGLSDAVSASREAVSGRIDMVQSTLSDRISVRIDSFADRQAESAVQLSALTDQVNRLTRSVEDLSRIRQGSLGSAPPFLPASPASFELVWRLANHQLLQRALEPTLYGKLQQIAYISVNSSSTSFGSITKDAPDWQSNSSDQVFDSFKTELNAPITFTEQEERAADLGMSMAFAFRDSWNDEVNVGCNEPKFFVYGTCRFWISADRNAATPIVETEPYRPRPN